MRGRRQRALAPLLDSLAIYHRHEPRDDERSSDGCSRQMCVTRKQHEDQCNDARSDPKSRDDGDGLFLAIRLGAHAASMPAINQHREAIRTAADAHATCRSAGQRHERSMAPLSRVGLPAM